MSDQMLVKAAAKSLRINPVEKDKKPDRHKDGTVRAVNSDGTYAVVLDEAPETPITCVPYCTAMVGDRVAVVLRSDGVYMALGRQGGEIGGGGEVVMTVNDASNYVAGKVFAHAGTNDPAGALLCDGRAVSRTTYWELFAAIGTTYGEGDGSTTFNLPNIESRTIIGESDSYALGATGGEEKHALTAEENGPHSHNVKVNVNASTQSYYANVFSAAAYEWINTWNGVGHETVSNNQATNITMGSGSGVPHNNMQPYIVMRYFITTGKGDPVSGINPADYLVDWKRDDDGWDWEKWASGKAVCWGLHLSTPYGTGQNHFSLALPFSFEGEYQVDITPSYNCFGIYASDFADCDGYGNVNHTEDAFMYTYKYNSSSFYNVGANFRVTGKWKDSPASGGTESIAPTIAERFEGIEADVAELLENPENKILWSGAHYMTASQTATLSEAISKQKHGVILVFSGYDPSTASADNYGWNFHPVPKSHVAKHNGAGCVFNNWNSSGNWLCINYIYVHDTKLTGSAQNGTGETSLGGSDTLRDNSGHVLRYVIGY